MPAPANGTLTFLTADDVEVATLTFSKPAFGEATDGVAIANPLVSNPSSAGGTIIKAEACASDGNVVFACSVGVNGSGADIECSSVDVGVGQEFGVVIGMLWYIAPP
jgi:hypothetical protein